MAIATGPTVQESTNVRHVTDSMPEPHVPAPPLPQQGQGNPKTPLILPTPIKVKVLDSCLEDYDPEDGHFIVNWFTKGFH